MLVGNIMITSGVKFRLVRRLRERERRKAPTLKTAVLITNGTVLEKEFAVSFSNYLCILN